VVALQNLLNPAVEAFDHAVSLGRLWWGQAMLDTEISAERGV
jgi:hypothetical protein